MSSLCAYSIKSRYNLIKRIINVIILPDRLNLPSVLVLNGCGISNAGDEGEIAAFCAHVVELDLSHNKLQDWHEVGILFICTGHYCETCQLIVTHDQCSSCYIV